MLLSTLGAVAAAVVLLGAPLAVAFEVLVTRRALDALQQQANGIQAVLNQQDRPSERSAVLLRMAEDTDLRLILLDAGAGNSVLLTDSGRGEPPPPFDDDVETATETGDIGRAHAEGTLAVSIPVRAGGVRQILRALQDDGELRGEIHSAWRSIAGLALLALGVATMAALWQGRRLARPLEALAASARRLGDGDFSARAPRSGLPEPDDVASALDTTATRLAAMLERSRSFSADASHQLRTPLTALRLDLEALEAAGADPALVAAAVAEADRLEETITELLALSEAPRRGENLDLAALVADRVDAWRALARAQGREVKLSIPVVPAVEARAAALGQSLQVLLDNALAHGTGTITVSVRQVAGGVRLCVEDEGPGIPPERELDLFDRTPVPAAAIAGADSGTFAHAGRGLPLARSLVEAEGGRIFLERPRPGAVVCLLLPLASSVAS